MNSFRTLLSAFVVLLAVACGRATDLPLPPGEQVASNLPRELTAAPSADVTQAASNNADFAFDLYRKLVTGDDNLFFSPHSISVALAMTYGGSNGGTKTAFETTMKQSLTDSAYHRAMNDLDRQLESRGQGAKAADGKAFRLTVANQLFAQRDFSFETPYLDLLAQEYGASVRLLNFAEQPELSRQSINAWVETRTENRIKELLAQGTVGSDTVAVLVNAIYFNAAWKTPFEPAETRNADFHQLDGTRASVSMMHVGDVSARAATVNGTEVVELPYDGDELSALILMPPAGQLPALESSLTSAHLKTLTAGLRGESLELSMPKFELRTSTSLAGPLKDLGLGVIFGGEADFSKMSKARLEVSDVIHQAFVKVNEAGTEAAAATAVVIRVTSLPSTRPLVLDRPFMMLIRDNATGAIVFAGRIAAP